MKRFLLVATLLLSSCLALAQGSGQLGNGVPGGNQPGIFPSLGPGLNNYCNVDGVVNTSIAACATYFNNSGLTSGLIWSNTPERITQNPFPSTFSTELRLGNGLNSSLCDSTHVNCWVTEVPLILSKGSTVTGLGRVSTPASNVSAGTVIIPGTNFPAALGTPAAPSYVCNSTGGFLSNGTYFVQVAWVNNINTFPAATTVGISSPSLEGAGVSCAGGTSTQSITVNPPAASAGVNACNSAGCAAQDYYVYAATASGQEVRQLVLASNFSCATPGVLDTTTCKMGTVATIQAIESGAAAGGSPPFIDLSNPMIVEGSTNGATQFSIELRDLTLSCWNTQVNNPNVLIWMYGAQEGSGAANGQLTMHGVCGPNQAGSVAAYIYANQSPNSRLEHIQSGNGPTAGTFYSIILDSGLENTNAAGSEVSGVSGAPRLLEDITSTPKGGATVPAVVLLTGATNVRQATEIVGSHFENTANDCVRVTNGAYVGIHGLTCGAGAMGAHLTTTGGGMLVENLQSNATLTIQDDQNAYTAVGTYVPFYLDAGAGLVGANGGQSVTSIAQAGGTPTVPTTGAGKNGGATLFQAGAGSAGGTTSGAGGVGGNASLTAGNGGNAVSGANGAGGNVILNPGSAGAGAGTAGAIGQVQVARGALAFITGKGQHLITQAASNDVAGTCTAAAATTCTVTFTTAYTAAPSCIAVDQTNITTLKVTPSTTTLVITTTASSSDVFAYHCVGNPN